MDTPTEVPENATSQEQALPIHIQNFLWRQISPFIRPKLGKLHEASCMFCQSAPGHHELKEACKMLEKVLVQNIQFGLDPDLKIAISSVPRWRFIQAAFPHVMHCAATLLHNRKDTNMQTLGAAETKLLYILHWIILDALDECAESDKENKVYRLDPYYYLHSIPTITLFIYLFAPLSHHIKESDLETFRLENGRRLWKAMWEYRHPDSTCFKALCKRRPRMLWDQSLQCGTSSPPTAENTPARSTAPATTTATTCPVSSGIMAHSPVALHDIYYRRMSIGEESRSPLGELILSEAFLPSYHPTGSQPSAPPPSAKEESGWVSSPKDTVFPETIPEESSSTEEEHMVVFRLSSLSDSDHMKEDSLFYQLTAISGSDTRQPRPKTAAQKARPPEKTGSKKEVEKDKEEKEQADLGSQIPKTVQAAAASAAAAESQSSPPPTTTEPQKIDLSAATFLDVAVLRCLFIPQWQEEGVYWALQFLYHRLRDIAEDLSHQQEPRKRSNSLPIPKIQVSLYQSPELKKRSGDSAADSESKDFITLPDTKDVSLLAGETATTGSGSGSESPCFRRKHSGDEGGSHFRRASEKVKRKMKMSDLRAFVETKLLSKSEKTLEKIGRDEPKPLAEQIAWSPPSSGNDPLSSECVMASTECHCSLDAGDDHLSLSRPGSAQGGDNHGPASNLVKGKSMPSLSCLLDELNGGGYIGEAQADRHKRGRFPNTQSHSIPNPIITVTEHTPTPSPDFLHRQSRQGSIDSQLDLLSHQDSGKQTEERKASLARSQTDSNITYQGDDLMEAPGSGHYITRDGDIDFQVVLKAVHAAAMRESPCCTFRVCEVILNLLELLIELGVLKAPTASITNGDGKSQHASGTGAVGAGSLVGTGGKAGSDHGSPTSEHDPGSKEGHADKMGAERYHGPHSLSVNSILRVIKHLGCPHGCADGQRGPPVDFVRSQGQNILAQLQRASPKQFHNFLRYLVRVLPLQQVLDLFHSLVGFCVDPSTLLSPMNQKRSSSKSPDITSQGGYSTNFGVGLNGGGRGVESHIMLAIFKPLVTRLVQCSKELKTPDNVNLMCDVRQLMTYIKEAHGGVFRRVALSGLLDCATKPNRKERVPQTTRVIKHITHSEMSDQPELMPGSCYVVDNQGSRKLLLKKRSTSSTCASLLETELSEEGPTKSSQSPLGPLRRKPHVLTPRHSERNLGGIAEGLSAMGGFGMSPGMSMGVMAAREREKNHRFKIGGLVSWFRKEYGRTDSVDSQDAGSEDGALIRQASLHHSLSMGQKPPNVGERLMRARRRMEDHFISKLGFGKGKKKDGGMEDTQGTYLSRRNSVDLGDHNRESEFVVFKERKLVPTEPVRMGMARLSFLLETCQPGGVPDSHLLAASLDLPHAPVVARAAMLLECSYFVHCCNKGQWPGWMKQNLPLFRPSGPLPVPARGPQLPPGLRRTHSLQRAAGKMFFQWAEALGTRLEELLAEDKKRIPQMVSMVLEEGRHKDLLMEDEEEDFLDEANVNIYGSECPMALRMVACMLLLEITAFMRETFQTLPKLSRASQRGERPPPWERVYSREANRRWSMAFSSMGHSQTSAQSMQSIAGDPNAGNQAERKISFVLHEPDNESEGSSKSIVTMQGEEGAGEVSREEKRPGRHGGPPQSSAPGSASANIPPSAPPSYPPGPGPGSTAPGSAGPLVASTAPSAPPAPLASTSAGSGRPFLLRRGTTSSSAVPSGSIKRRSLKLRRHTKEAKELAECEVAAAAATAQVKRTDSIQSKRKVSSLSDRSDTSEQGAGGEVSGEESPGILSDDQPPESPSDSNDTEDNTSHLPWLKVMVQLSKSFNFYCSHQQFCHPFCYRRHMRACSRLIKSVRKVYGEEFGIAGQPENDDKQREEAKKENNRRSRKVSDQTSTQASPIRRKDSDNKRDRLRDAEGSQTGRTATRDSSRDITLSDPDADGAVSLAKKKNGSADEKSKEQPPILKYLKTQVRDIFHAPLALLVKGAVVLTEDQLMEMLPVTWELLLEHNQEVAATAASLFILAAVKAPIPTTEIMRHGLQHHDPAIRIKSILRFQVLWKLRYQVWPRMEEGAQVTFKVLPPGIEFTLPSPKIGIESLPVVDPPWSPQVTSKVEEVTISQESHVRRRLGERCLGLQSRAADRDGNPATPATRTAGVASRLRGFAGQFREFRGRVLVSGTKTRKKQQTELVKQALAAQEHKRRQERENFLITTIPVTVQAAYEPSLYHAVGDDHEETGVDEEADQSQARNTSHLIHSAHSLFPSCLCSAVIQITNLLDDAAVSPDGNAVYEVAYQVIWNCLVEDSALFLRYVLERLTRDHQELMFKLLRHLIRFIPKLPQQAAFALYNYIIGYVMFYVRSPQEDGQRLIGTALSILWMVVHSVHGIMFKDLKQILRKEQCDASILLTANVPSAKKIIVHGPQEPEAGLIPSQFPVQEDTQFCQILRESLDYCGIDENRHKEYYLIDYKTHQIHNPSSYVRDFYFFKRSQYPELGLVHMKPEDAFNALQHQQFLHKFVEIGKVLLTWAILKNVDMVVQRVVFLHEELMKLPSFPRKALEADLDLYKGGEIGRELLGLDVLHKFMWVRLIARMFEAMAGNFAYSGDIHLSLNVLNGAVILHSEDACILRYVMATYINAAYHFKNIFSTNGYLLIIPTLLQLYSSHQTNSLVTRTVEYTVKQFYLMNRKPFILQMFGSVSAILDTDEDGQYGDAHKVRASDLFNLLLSLETPSPDPLNIGELVKEEKPLKAIDFCYHDEDEMVNVLDCISLCVMVIAYAADSVRGHQMLIILDAILPCYLQQIQLPSYNRDGKTEKEIIQQLAVALRTMVSNCEALAKHYTGPQKESSEHKGSSQRNFSRGPYSPGYDFEDDSHSKYISDHARTKINYERDMEDSEVLRNEYRRPRDILLSMVAEFLTKCTARLAELNKKPGGDNKPCELFDVQAHVRLAEVAYSLLKVSPYDPVTMACKGLQRYMVDVLPYAEWSNEQMRPALIQLLRRLEKVFSKIYKKPAIRCLTNWEAAAGLLKGIYEAMFRYKYIVHMQHLKNLVNTCQALIIGEPSNVGILDSSSQATTAATSQVPPPQFCSTVVRLIALQIVAIGETYSLEHVCGGTSVFPTQEKTEKMLINLLMPLCLRVGSGRKDVAPLRPADISFVLTVVLHAISPPATKTAPVTAQTIKSASDTRAGSLTGSHSDAKKHASHKVSTGLYKVAFLALRILMVCFERELAPDWPRVAHTLRDLVRHKDAGPAFWNFIDFVVTQRTALFVLLRPFIYQKLSQPAPSEEERHTMFVVREKMRGFSLPLPKSRGTLLMELAQEMKKLKEELEKRRSDEQKEIVRHAPDVHSRRRPSIMEIFTGSSHQNEPPRCVHRESVGSVASSIRGIKEDSVKEKKAASGEPTSPNSPEEENSNELANKPRLQRCKAQSRKTFRLRKSKKNQKTDQSKSDPQRQLSADAQLSPRDATDLPEVSELMRMSRHMSVRARRGSTDITTSMTLPHHSSPQHHHSTLALTSQHPHTHTHTHTHGAIARQSRLGSIGERGLHASVDSRYPLGFSSRQSEIGQQEISSPFGTPSGALPTQAPPSSAPIPIPSTTENTSSTAHRGLVTVNRGAAGSGRPSAPVPGAGLVTTSARSSAQDSSLVHSDLSFDEDSVMTETSSTSGYRENCSLLGMVPLEITPDDRPSRPASTSTTTVATTVAADSPEHSSCGNTSTTPTGDGETTALLGPGYSDSHSHSQHSLLFSSASVFERQDEDTLI